MGIQLGSAYGKVSIDASGVVAGVKKAKDSLNSLQQAGQRIGALLTSAGQAMTLGLTLPIVAAGTAAVKMASDLNETVSKAKVVFGSMADSIIKNAKRADEQLGLSQQNYLDYSSSIAAALKAGGMGVKASAELSEKAVKHFADLASFHNAQVEDVSAAWQSAIRGQYEPIQRYFPFINDAYMKTYGTAKGLIDKTTENLTANQRAIILNAIALDEKLNPAIDDFAETSGGLANQTRIMQAQLKNVGSTLGDILLPYALKAVAIFKLLLSWFQALSPGIQTAIVAFLGLLAVIGPVLVIVGQLITAISTIGVVLSAAAPVIAVLLVIIAAVGLFYVAWGKNWGGIQGKTRAVLISIKSLIKSALYQIQLWWAEHGQLVWIKLKQMWAFIMTTFEGGVAWVRGIIQNALERMRDWWDQHGVSVIARLKKLWQWIATLFVVGGNWVQIALRALSGVWTGTLLPAIQAVWAWMNGTLFPFLMAIAQWLQNNIPIALRALSMVWTGTLLPAIQAVWAWMSGTLFPFLMKFMQWWFQNNMQTLTVLSGVWKGTLLPAIQKVWAWMNSTLLPFLMRLVGWLQTNIPVALKALSDVWKGTLLPAIQEVWKFISGTLFPFLVIVANFIGAVFRLAIAAFAVVWRMVLLPALTAVWQFLQNNVMPILRVFWAFLQDNVIPIVKFLADLIIKQWVKGFKDLSDTLEIVTGWVNSLIKALDKLKLPDDLTPGSPTPFEMGLRGVRDILKEIAVVELPSLNMSMSKLNGLGNMGAFAQVDPSDLARSIAKPAPAQPGPGAGGVLHQTQNFASGLTLRDVSRMLDERDRQLMQTLNGAFGGAA